MGCVVMLGAPGAGKGTQAQRIARDLGMPHISSGDIFREHLKNETELGKRAAAYMNEGKLVPDDLTIEMVKDRLSRMDCEGGAVLDGFPRTPTQADALAEILKDEWAAFMVNHGIVCAGRSLRKACDMIQVIDRTAEVILGCYAVGKEPPLLPEDSVKKFRAIGDMIA